MSKLSRLNNQLEEEISMADEYVLPSSLSRLIADASDSLDNTKDPQELRAQIAIIRGLIKKFQKTEVYQETLEAYRKQDKERLRNLIPKIFRKNIPIEIPAALYHGISPRQFGHSERNEISFSSVEGTTKPASIEDYVDKIEKILEKGLKPSKVNEYYGMDKNLRGIFFGKEFYFTKPIIRLELTREILGDNPVFLIEGFDDEHLIFTPNLKKEFNLVISPKEYYTEFDYRGWAYPEEMKTEMMAELDYLSKTQRELEKRGLNFKVFESN